MEENTIYSVLQFCFYFFGVIDTSAVANETSYMNCLTWEDDLDVLRLKCSVTDFVLPVTFIHNASNTEVQCDIREQRCSPKLQIFTVYDYSNMVTVEIFEKKSGRDLNGLWYCRQGDRVQSTDVSFGKGIISDPSIYLRGRVEQKSQNLYLECSSCRKPKHLYIEILINGKTEGSFRQTNEECWYKNVLCTKKSKLCKCSETQNAFSLNLQLTKISALTNISCFMTFYDSLRGTTFFVTVSHEFRGQDFRETGNTSHVLYVNPNPAVPTLSTRRGLRVYPEKWTTKHESITKHPDIEFQQITYLNGQKDFDYWTIEHGSVTKHSDLGIRERHFNTDVFDDWTTGHNLVTQHSDLDIQQQSFYTIGFEDFLKRYAVQLGILLILVVILTVAGTIFICKKCNTLRNRQECHQENQDISHVNTTLDSDYHADDIEHGYSSVNENEMIPDEIIFEMRCNDVNSFNNHTSDNTSSPYLDVIYDTPVINEHEINTTNSEYLDVVNDVPVHEYMKTKTKNDDQDGHDYTPFESSSKSPNRIYINEVIW